MLKDKVVWIIGSNSDIAKDFVKKYNNQFKKIVLASRNFDAVKRFDDELDCNNTLCYQLDLSESQSIDSFIEGAPTPNIVLLFAGHILYDSQSEVVTDENIKSTIRTNIEGPAILLERIAPLMQSEKDGMVVAFSSCAGIRGKSSNRFYSASKSALTTYLQGFMQENEPYGIKTIIIKLGHADTKMLKNISNDKQKFSCSSQDVADLVMKCLQKNRSVEIYFKGIWKYLSIIYKAIPLHIYKKIKF